MLLFAPYPLVQTVTLLPEPQLLNQIAVRDTRQYNISMDKTVYSYVKRSDEFVYIFRFFVTREKAEEIFNFVKEYSSEQWRILDHHNEELIGYLNTNPITATYEGLYTGPCTQYGYSLNERTPIDIEFVA